MTENGADSCTKIKGTKTRTPSIDGPFLFPPPERKAAEAESCQNTIFTCSLSKSVSIYNMYQGMYKYNVHITVTEGWKGETQERNNHEG